MASHVPPGTSGIPIRPARAGDGHAIAEIRCDGWRRGYRGIIPDQVLAAMRPDGERFERLVRSPESGVHHLLAELDGRPAGWLCLGPSRDSDTSPETREIYACYVHPESWRLGVGRALMASTLDGIGGAPVILWVLEGNAGGRRFYEALDFRFDGRERELDQRLVMDGEPVVEVRYTRDPVSGRRDSR